MPSHNPQTPYLWANDADELLPTRGVGRIARTRVVVDEGEGALVATLPVNPRFDDPNRIDRDRGVEVGEREQYIGEEAIARRVLAELLKRDTLRAWTTREARVRGGNGPLARALMGAAGNVPASDPAYRAQIRKVQEWKQGKYTHPAGVNAARLAQLRGAPHPAAVRIAATSRSVTLGVTGLWLMSSDQRYRRFNTDRQDTPAAVAVLAENGVGLVDTVEEAINGESWAPAVELLTVHGLHVEVSA